MWHMCMPGDLSGNGIEWYFLADEQFDDTKMAIQDIALFKDIIIAHMTAILRIISC